jgi:hypothetical protein
VPLGVLRAMRTAVRGLHPGIAQVLQASIVGETTDLQRFDAQPLAARFPIALVGLEDWVLQRVERAWPRVSGRAGLA